MYSPTPRQRLRYEAGGVLSADLNEWVRRGLTGRGASARYLARFLVPLGALLFLFLLFPGPNWVAAAMMSMIFVPVLYFSVALHMVYRELRLRQHGIESVRVAPVTSAAEIQRALFEAEYRPL